MMYTDDVCVFVPTLQSVLM